ncbi:ribonuclease III [Tindallia californiensis]|uniref:Ribonuclease 3 n=1 Tax=Tindallia californiensis TaxID=159292 RepID=A0A1H3NTH3_9FIRM|nr:ribonuclease III [Tindallia californiensis]SDY92182.1 RNAse III [Tindallia californiensis]
MKSIEHWNKGVPILSKKIGYVFRDQQLLMEALTHSSFANEWKHKRIPNNERLEFLGDSVLGLVISRYIFHTFRNLPEGELTKVRASVVCEASLAKKARELMLGEHILLGKGEETSGGKNRESILADAMEALIAALYIDGKYEKASEFVIKHFEDIINLAVHGELMKDYKTSLQEKIQRFNSSSIEYVVVREEGPDHSKIFYVDVRSDSKILGSGSGRNKKEAEQNAAKAAIQYLS